MFRKDRNDKRGSFNAGKSSRSVRKSDGSTDRPKGLNTNRKDWKKKEDKKQEGARFTRSNTDDKRWNADRKSYSKETDFENKEGRNKNFSSDRKKESSHWSNKRENNDRPWVNRNEDRRSQDRFNDHDRRDDRSAGSFERRNQDRFSRGGDDRREGDRGSFERRNQDRYSRGEEGRKEGDRGSFERRSQDQHKRRDDNNRFDHSKRYQDRDGKEGKSYSGFDRSRDHYDKKKPYNSDKREDSDGRKRTRKLLNEDQQLIGNWRKDAPNREGFPKDRPERKSTSSFKVNTDTDLIRLNKFLANAGLCSRREADDYILNGSVTVNGTVINELGIRINPRDEVRFKGRLILPEKPVYIVMNKPKDVITTSDDPDGRKIITDLVRNEVKERVFPVGRLDRNTTGVILLTNDGDLSQKLTHPSYEIHKVYMATLDKPLTQYDFDTLIGGIELEDGVIQPDALAWLDDSKMNIGVEIHSGKNRIIHRMFNHLGYMVDKLDRVAFAGITKDGLRRGDFRFLSENDLMTLRKNIGKAKKN